MGVASPDGSGPASSTAAGRVPSRPPERPSRLAPDTRGPTAPASSSSASPGFVARLARRGRGAACLVAVAFVFLLLGAEAAQAAKLVSNTGQVSQSLLQDICTLDTRKYPKGVTAADAENTALALHRDEFRGDWSYEIHSQQKH